MTKLLLEGSCLAFQPCLAERLGLNEAIILQQLHYWTISCNKKEVDGFIWVYNTYAQWQKQFPFWSEVTVKRAIKSLESQGIILSRSGLKRQNKTKFYAVNYNKISELNLKTSNDTSDQIDSIQRSNSSLRQVNLISSINKEAKTTLKTNKKEYLSKELDDLKNSKAEETLNSEQIKNEKDFRREMIDIWNKVFTEEGREEIKLTPARIKALGSIFENYFASDLTKWQDYCLKISSSKFLMGEITNFKASIDWCLREETITKILEGTYKCGDRVGGGKISPTISIKPMEVKSQDPIWLKVVEKFQQLNGEATAKSWLWGLDFEKTSEESVEISSSSKFILSRVENHYLRTIETIIKGIDGGIERIDLSLKNSEELIRLAA